MTDKKTNTIYLTIAVAVVGTLTVGGIIGYSRYQRQKEYDVLIASIDAGANENGDASDLQAKGNTLDKNYWKTKGNCTIDDEAANKKAMAIHDAGKGGIANMATLSGFTSVLSLSGIASLVRTDSNRQAVKSIFSSFSNKCDASRVADVFYSRYKVDLYDFLKDFMNEDEMRVFVEDPLKNLS